MCFDVMQVCFDVMHVLSIIVNNMLGCYVTHAAVKSVDC